MVAGAAALDLLDREAIGRINLLGEKLANGIIAAATSKGLGLSVTSYGSLLNLHSLPEVRTPVEAQIAAAQPMKRLLHLKLLEHGIFIAPRGEICISTAMDETTIDVAIEAIGLAFDELGDTSEC
jgi:glutamate-1-semialdehyde aminotransferase